MRISTGLFKGLYLKPIKGIRPTQDKVKSAVFDILQESIKDVSFLELFSGSGAVGFEALSRGAREATFIDNNPDCIKSIRDTLKLLTPKIKDKNIEVFRSDAMKAIEKLQARDKKFDIVFADPPYYKGDFEAEAKVNKTQEFGAKKALQTLGQYDIITASGLVIIQAFKREDLNKSYASLELQRSYKYGGTVLLVYKKV